MQRGLQPVLATLEYMLGSIDRDGLQATLHAFLPEQS
jgi:hypothetical protein